jgi:dihydromethanopterin reductase
MADIRVVCAIGLRGQLGLHGAMPWEGATGPEYIADVARFFDLTRGHVLLAGPVTYRAFPDFARGDRTVIELRSSMQPAKMVESFPGRSIFICGGPVVWAAYARYVRHWDVTRLPYDGDADRWFDPTWLIQNGNDTNRRQDARFAPIS